LTPCQAGRDAACPGRRSASRSRAEHIAQFAPHELKATLFDKPLHRSFDPLRRAGVLPHQSGTCDILHLTLGPLDLNLLGLMVHLDRVVLDITAQSGPGQLLGNLLWRSPGCSTTTGRSPLSLSC
jgi:hypothetical protein